MLALIAVFAIPPWQVIQAQGQQLIMPHVRRGQTIKPPFKRTQTLGLETLMRERGPLVVGDTAYVLQRTECIATDLRTFRPLWRKQFGKDISPASVAYGGKELYVCTDPAFQKDDSKLYALNSNTGAVLWQIPRKGRATAMAVNDRTLIAALSPRHVSAIDRITHRPVWTTQLSKGSQEELLHDALEQITVARTKTSETVLAYSSSTLTAIDAKTGKSLWCRPGVYLFENAPVATGNIVWVPTNYGSEGREVRSGKLLWQNKSDSYAQFGGVLGGLFVGLDNGTVCWLDPATGASRRSSPLKQTDFVGGNQFGARLNATLFASNAIETVAIDADGRTLWKEPSKTSISRPIWTDGKSLVCFDGSRLIRYIQGESAALPTSSADRRALADQMVAHFKDLDPTEVEKLGSLKDDAFEPVLRRFLVACADYKKHENDAGMEAYELYHDLAKVLDEVTTAKRSDELLEALKQAPKDGEQKPFLLGLLAQYGEPSKVVPFFLKELQGPTPRHEMYESATFVAREYIQRSSDPAAVQFMMAQLQNATADDVLKEAAYDFLAGTGGPEGAKAVLALRKKRHLLPTIEERMALSHIGHSAKDQTITTLLEEKKGKDGRTWGLLQCGILGSEGDLWLAEKVGGQWVRPRFTGVSSDGISHWAKGNVADRTIGGKTAKQLMDGAWFTTLVGNPLLDQNTGNSDLTDLEKKRLGLPLATKDADGDGDADGIDPWPNAPLRTLSEAEQILAAAFEARYHFYKYSSTAIFFAPQDMKPFEMVGWPGPVIWHTESPGEQAFSTDLERCYEQGVALIRFTPPRSDRQSKPGKWEDTLISWNATHTVATVELSTYYGGLNGTGYEITVTKFGDTWVVAGMRMAYIS